MIGDPHSPIWPPPENPFSALHRYLPSNHPYDDASLESDDFDVPVDAYSCDDFRMFDFKVKQCARSRSHDWTDCPFAHPGEKARRRDPRRYRYSGTACPDFRKAGACRRGDGCEYAHGVFEVWLHPARYRTQPCKDGTHCRRRVCFFAHTPEQLRVLPITATGSDDATDSPPVSPLSRISEPIRHLQGNKMMLLEMGMAASWGLGLGSPRLWRLPSAATEEEPAMERVESGRAIREKIYAKLGRENSLDRVSRPAPVPSWISELVT